MPRKKITETTVFTFGELSDEAKDHARDKWREQGLDYGWWENTFEDAVRVGKILGIEIHTAKHRGFAIYFDLDRDRGCVIEASYRYAKGGLKAIRKEAPASWKDRKTGEVTEHKPNAELHEVARKLQEVQRISGYKIEATVMHRSRHMTAQIDVSDNEGYAVTLERTQAVEEALKDFMHWILCTLEREQEYLMSDEQIDEMLADLEFDENGNVA